MKTKHTDNSDGARNMIKKMILELARIEKNDDRATMAALRSGLRTTNGIALEMMPFMSEYLPEKESPRIDAHYFQIAALFSLHPKNTFGTYDDPRKDAFAKSFRLLADKGSESIEKRFQMLLAGRDEDLFRHLQQAVSLLKSENIPINWTRLLEDLTYSDWDDPDRKIQLKWAREFYRQPTAPASENEDAS